MRPKVGVEPCIVMICTPLMVSVVMMFSSVPSVCQSRFTRTKCLRSAVPSDRAALAVTWCVSNRCQIIRLSPVSPCLLR